MPSDLIHLRYTQIRSYRPLDARIQTRSSPWAFLIHSVQIIVCAIGILVTLAPAEMTLAQSPVLTEGASGMSYISQFANPAVRGSLYLIPQWPMTGYYPVFPASLTRAFPGNGVLVGPLRVHPHMGVAQMYTDNVFRTNSNKTSDFVTNLAPGIQAQLPFAGFHSFLIDYRTNLQYYSKTSSSNNVQDQTALGAFRFNFPGGLNIDLQGEYKLGHDPRGSALDNVITQGLEVNKWTTNGFTGQAEYLGARSSVTLYMQTLRWDYLNNNLGPSRDRRTNRADLSFSRDVTSKTSILASVSAFQSIYDQNKNMDNVMYTFSGGGRWNLSDVTYAEILGGYQYVRYTHAQVDQPPPLSQFVRDKDTYSNFYFMGKLNWQATPLLGITLQAYRAIQQTVVSGSLFYTATGVNLTARHALTDSTTFNINFGYEHDNFQSSSSLGTSSGSDRIDQLKNVAVGVEYRAVEWVGLGAQYIFEDRHSTQTPFTYQANTFMLSAQTLF